MKKILMIKYGEISLKGLNRRFFIDTLMKNCRKALYAYKDEIKIFPIQGRIIIKNYDIKDEEDIISRLLKVFGIVSITPAYEIEKNEEEIRKTVVMAVKEAGNVKTFKAESRRSDKSFPLKSPEINQLAGAAVLKNIDNIKVDVHNPDIVVNVEVRENTYVYAKEYEAGRGLPVGTGGVGGLLLSGGLDSPVAGYLMNKRGMKLVGIHFHTYPYTSKNAQKKVEDLSKIIAPYNMGMRLHAIGLTKIQEEIIANCNQTYLTVILRRFMIKCANLLAKEEGIQALVTGESLGQVASQTTESISCTNACSEIPIFRPLIAMDKTEIMAISRKIGTYDTSILPYEDCCTVFVPKHPQIKPSLDKVLLQEKLLNCDFLMEEAVRSREIINI